MNPKEFVGKTLAELAERTTMFWKPVHVFVLQDENDDIGVRLMDAYSIKQVIQAYPAAAGATIIIAYKYYEEVILRVRF